MKINKDKINGIIEELNTIINTLKRKERDAQKNLDKVHPNFEKSAQNLVHYKTMRTFDLRSIQKHLKHLGLTRLANAEGNVMDSLSKIRFILQKLVDVKEENPKKVGVSIKKAHRLLSRNTKELLGYRSKDRRVRIMVTQPTQAADDYEMVYEMVKNGMNCARINCAHDAEEVWEKIIMNVKRAAKSLGKNVKIAMDLAGPKIRTGEISKGPKLLKLKPKKDVYGKVMEPLQILLTPNVFNNSGLVKIPVQQRAVAKLKIDDIWVVKDARGKSRKLRIIKLQSDGAVAECAKTTYISTGDKLRCKNRKSSAITVGDMPAVEQAITLFANDILKLTKSKSVGTPKIIDENGNTIRNATISCQMPEIFEYVKLGHRILFDDGKIEGVVEEVYQRFFNIRIINAAASGSKLKMEKGINFPDTDLGISGLTEKDKVDLGFIAQNADIVNFSFVSSKKDVKELYQELEKHGVLNKINVIFKIETRSGFHNLFDILLTAMQSSAFGVMIARGDLAVETGWDKIGKIQRDILSICGAAHIPVIWATQVLENLAKSGLPSRAEITDTVTALKAECVMLNKGPYINQAMLLLNTILSDMEVVQEKKEVMLPILKDEKNGKREGVRELVS